MKLKKRSGGVLAHPTSFPGPYGIGDFGAGAYEFVDFLCRAKQTLWQVLPLGPTSYGDSPYQSFSSFALNHYLISPTELVKQGYLKEQDIWDIPGFDPRRIDYGEVITYKMGLYAKAFNNFNEMTDPVVKRTFNRFCTKNKSWLDDYALFVAIKNHYIEERRNSLNSPELKEYRKANAKYLNKNQINDYFYGAVWGSWPSGLVWREPAALAKIGKTLKDDIMFHKFLQFEASREWQQLKDYANKKGITVIGDIPIFVAMDSSDVWASPSLFHLDAEGRPTVVAGVPPDYFSSTGQLWGNPLYDWKAHKKTSYEWWIHRVRSVLDIVDIVRIDHFRGLDAYWAIPYGAKTAVRGKWQDGPGADFFKALIDAIGFLPIIAEDLGVITPTVDKLRTDNDLPGMKVLQFAFDPSGKNDYMPHNFDSDNTVVYSGTHDNDTTIGWYATAAENEKDYFRRYMNISGDEVSWDLIRLAYSSSGKYAIVPIQDIMGLGAYDRMNLPGEPVGNWQFRYTKEMLEESLAQRLAYLTELYNR